MTDLGQTGKPIEDESTMVLYFHSPLYRVVNYKHTAERFFSNRGKLNKYIHKSGSNELQTTVTLPYKRLNGSNPNNSR